MTPAEGTTTLPNPDLVQSLIHNRTWALHDETVENVHRRMVDNSLNYMAICSSPGRLVGLASLSQLAGLLGRRFGLEIYGGQAVGRYLLPAHLVLRESTTVQEIVDEVFSRPERFLFDDVAIEADDGRFLGLIRATTLVTLQNALLREKLAQVERHERVLKEQNDRLETLAAELNQANHDLTHANQETLHVSRLKEEFLANMSHEIRTPMNGILGVSSLLLETPLEPGQLELVRTVNDSAEALLRIINDILDFTKMSAGQVEICAERFRLHETIESSLLVVAARAAGKGLELIGDIHPEVPDRVVGDGVRLRQILLNLVGNAVKFTEEGHVRLTVSTLRSSARSAEVRFTIEDTGPGIPLDLQPELFQPFKQADSSRTRVHGGTGLGLSISRTLVELMRGHIGFESAPGAGATFWFDLPLLVEGVSEAAETAPPLAGEALLIEPHKASRLVLQRQLERHFTRVHSTGDLVAADLLLEAWRERLDTIVIALEADDGPLQGWLQSRCGELPGQRLIYLHPFGHRPPAELRAPNLHTAAWHLSKPLRQSDLAACLEGAAPPPVRPKPVARPKAASAPFPAPPGSAPDQPRILVVEDNLTNQRVIQLMLSPLGLAVHTVANGLEAIDALRAHTFVAILMDCQMPVMDGFEATRRIRTDASGRNPADIPIIAMTANAMEGDRERCLAAGMTDYLSKPTRKAELEACVRRYLARRSGADDHAPAS
ncbi:MAG: ATP-binding protein [Opitutales bacterium]